MHRYIAPEHTTAVFTAGNGELRANSAGIISLPADAPLGDHQTLLAAGCILAPSTDSAAKPKAPRKRSSKAKGKAAKAVAPAAKPASAPAPEAKPEGSDADQLQG